MATTSPDNIWYPTGTDDVGDLKGDFAQLASSVQTAITNTKPATKSYKWANAAARTSQTGMTEGDTGYQLDNDRLWIYTGAIWSPLAGNMPEFKTLRGTTQNIPVGERTLSTAWGTPTAIDTEFFSWNASTGDLTILKAGVYEVAASVQVAAVAAYGSIYLIKGATSSADLTKVHDIDSRIYTASVFSYLKLRAPSLVCAAGENVRINISNNITLDIANYNFPSGTQLYAKYIKAV